MADEHQTTDQGDASKGAPAVTPQQNNAVNAGTSNVPASSLPPAQDDGIPEPVIIEETIIKPRAAPPSVPKAAAAPQTAAPMPSPRPVFPPKFIPPPITRPPAPVQTPPPASAPSAPQPAPVHPLPPTTPHPTPPAPATDANLDVGLPKAFVMPKTGDAQIVPPPRPASPVPPVPPVQPNPAPRPASPKAAPAAEVREAAQSAMQPPVPQTNASEPMHEVATKPQHPLGSMDTDISNILGGIKLPERHSVGSASKKTYEVKQFDTSLGADVRAREAHEHEAASTRVMPDVAPARMPQAAAQTPASISSTPKPASEQGEFQRPDVLVPVHTLKDDLQQVVHEQKISVVRAASLEQDRRVRDDDAFSEPMTPRRSSKRIVAILFSVAVLIVVGVGALFGVYLVEHARTATTNVPTQSSILFAENTVTFPLSDQSPNALKQALAQARSSGSATLGSITRIIPTISVPDATNGSVTERPATFAEFMQAIGANPPQDLLRSLSGDFFFGIHTVDKNAPVIIVPVTSYDHAFAAMLSWEPSLNSDLSPIFTAVSAQTTDASGLPTLRTFTDTVMRNYDVRALKDDAGTIQMYYSFPTQNILVIAESPYTFSEVLSRLQALREL